MNRASLLQETAAWMDTVDLALCLFIYEVSPVPSGRACAGNSGRKSS